MDTVNPAQVVFASFVVLGLLGLMAVVLRYYSQKTPGAKIFGTSLFTMNQNKGRIAIVETQYIDHKSKLVLVRRDEIEHLLLVGDGKTVVIESGIKHNA